MASRPSHMLEELDRQLAGSERPVPQMPNFGGESPEDKTTFEKVKKSLFQTPGVGTSTQENTQHPFMGRLQVEHDVETSLHSLQKELHEKRLKDLRKLASKLSEDDWRYESVDKLIGLE